MTDAASLPRLREELSLHPGPPAEDGGPTWTIRDPVRNRFFRIGWSAFEMLIRWPQGQAGRVADAVSRETTLTPSEHDVSQLAEFLVSNQLTQPSGHADTKRLAARAAAAERQSWVTWLLHHYLFFRIPLVRPDHFLDATVWLVRWLGSRWFQRLTILALLAGLFLVHREWDRFAGTIVDSISLSGFVGFGLALVSVKAVHELAHAYTAKNFGCRVPAMGVAFLVLWPMLYTDANDAWMLQARRQRLWVGAAGVVAELTVAAWATLAWAFLPEGSLKQAAFMLAAVTWISSLVINLSPFMRFDGYFVLMDALEMPNLHARAFAMGRWWLREALFGLGEPPPEQASPARRRALAAFAAAVWIYRLLLFLGIAVLVYHFFIKVVGIVLFVVEIGWFVLLPVWREIKEWFARRRHIVRSRRSLWTLLVITGLILLAAIPWRSRIEAPAVLKGAATADLYLPFPARLESVQAQLGDTVTAGQAMMTFTAPDVAHRVTQTLARLSGKQAAVHAAQIDPAYRNRLGVLLDVHPNLRQGQWLSPSQRLGVVQAAQGAAVDAYVREDDFERLSIGGTAVFVPDSLDFPIRRGLVAAIEPIPVAALADDMLASLNGGPIATRVDGPSLVPEGAWYRLRATFPDAAPPPIQLRGTLVLDGERRSLLERLGRAVLIVLVREWGM